MLGGRPSHANAASLRAGHNGKAARAAAKTTEEPTDADAVVLRAHPSNARWRPRGWVADTGASEHVCGPEDAAHGVRPTSTVVETANGHVRAVGRATVDVSGLGRTVEALVLPGAPRLLSVGSLVKEGYEMRWGKGSCALKPPGRRPVPLNIVDGIPTLPPTCAASAQLRMVGDDARRNRTKRRSRRGGWKARARRGKDAAKRIPHAHAVRVGADREHRQQGHYPWDEECATCNEAAMRSRQHARRLPHTGTLAVDIASLSQDGPHVLVGATQTPGYTYAEQLTGKSAEVLAAPLLRMLAAARRRGNIHKVHADRERGLLALEASLLAVGCELSCTQGHDPQANGLAEAAVGRLSRMARAVTHEYPAEVAGALWGHAMVWAAQRLGDPDMPPFGAKLLVRCAPKVKLSKLARRATPAVYLHHGARSGGAACVGILTQDGAIEGVVERVTTRAVLGHDGMWVFPHVRAAKIELRGRPRATAPADDGRDDTGNDVSASACGDSTQPGDGCEDAMDNGDLGVERDEDDVPLGERGLAPTAPAGAERDEDDIPFEGRGLVPAGLPTYGVEWPAPSEKRGRDEPSGQGGENPPQRARTQGDDVDMLEAHDPVSAGLVTRVVPMKSGEAKTAAAQDALKKELQNIVSKGVFCVDAIHDWATVRTQDHTAQIGNAMMILGCKNAELNEALRVYKGRMVFQGNRVRDATGKSVFGAPEDLYGKPVDLVVARTVIAAALIKDWGIDAADVDGAYLNAPLRGPAVYMRLTPALWAAMGVPTDRLAGARDPCVRLRKALYGLPRSGFDWYRAFNDMLTNQLGWSVVNGYDSVYQKKDALMAVYVDDVILAGTQRARRREWAALSGAIKLKEKPQPVDRFLGVKYSLRHTSTYKRELQMCQQEYVDQLARRYDSEAAHHAGKRAAPAAKVGACAPGHCEGRFSETCRTYVGALMYASRATRPDITFATNWLARHVSQWGPQQDKELGHLVGYLNATNESRLVAKVDVRDRSGELWLDLWVDSDHAGEPGRRSTSGWVVMLRGPHGTCIPIDWASKKQATVARSSGEAGTVAMREALGRVVGTNRALCSSGIPSMDAVEKLLGQKTMLRAMVDASVCKAAAEKGTSSHMKYISKTQQVDLFWLRDVVQRADVQLEKVGTQENLADLLTKPLCGPRTEALREAVGVLGAGQ